MSSDRNHRNQSSRQTRCGMALVVILIVTALLALVVAGAVRPVRDESGLATLRVETTRAFYGAESGAIIVMSAIIGQADMPNSGDSLVLNAQTINFVQMPGPQGVVIVEGVSGDAVRRIEFTIK